MPHKNGVILKKRRSGRREARSARIQQIASFVARFVARAIERTTAPITVAIFRLSVRLVRARSIGRSAEWASSAIGLKSTTGSAKRRAACFPKGENAADEGVSRGQEDPEGSGEGVLDPADRRVPRQEDP